MFLFYSLRKCRCAADARKTSHWLFVCGFLITVKQRGNSTNEENVLRFIHSSTITADSEMLCKSKNVQV